MWKSFDSLGRLSDKSLVEFLKRRARESIKDSDESLLELLQVFARAELFESDELLCKWLLQSVQERFEFMEVDAQLNFGLFLSKLGFWEWN